MGITKRLLAVLTAFILIAAACSDDPAPDAATVDSALDQIEESSDPPSEPAPEPEPEPDPEPAPEPAPEPEAPAVAASAACLWLYHYTSDLFPEAPYHAIIFGSLPDGPYSTIETEHPEHETVADVTEFSDGWGFTIYWPVLAPGPVQLPTTSIDGVDITMSMSQDFFGGITEFTAANADPIDDEQIVPVPCDEPVVLHQVDKVVG